MSQYLNIILRVRAIIKLKHLSLISIFTTYLIVPLGLNAQEVIHISNPSFEANRRTNRESSDTTYVLRGWINSGFNNESPPNIHTANDNLFDVNTTPDHGDFFMGLVTRHNGSYEGVYQQLPKFLKKEKQYSFSISLCTSEKLKSAVRNQKLRRNKLFKLCNFNEGAVFRIQASNSKTKENEVLAMSEVVWNTEWKKYDFTFSPNANYDIFILEVFFDSEEGEERFRNANILVDNCSPIIEMN